MGIQNLTGMKMQVMKMQVKKVKKGAENDRMF